jgi:hypothetical protein
MPLPATGSFFRRKPGSSLRRRQQPAATSVSRRSVAWSSTWTVCHLTRSASSTCTGSAIRRGRIAQSRRGGAWSFHLPVLCRRRPGQTSGNALERHCVQKPIPRARTPAGRIGYPATRLASSLSTLPAKGTCWTPIAYRRFLESRSGRHGSARLFVAIGAAARRTWHVSSTTSSAHNQAAATPR